MICSCGVLAEESIEVIEEVKRLTGSAAKIRGWKSGLSGVGVAGDFRRGVEVGAFPTSPSDL